MSMTLTKALQIRSAVTKIKKKLAAEGIDISDVKYITDLPPVLACILPDQLAEQAEALLSDEDTLAALLTAFTGSADIGALVNAIYRPSDRVKEGDIHA